jgi:hypothetical protein
MTIQHVSAGLGAVVGGAAGVVILAVPGLLLEPASWAFVSALALFGALKAWDEAAMLSGKAEAPPALQTKEA